MLGRLLLIVAVLEAWVAVGQPKYIWFAWDTQNCSAEEVLANADLFDATPYDGIPLTSLVDDPATGKKIRVSDPLGGPEITDAMMASQIPVYRSIVAHRSLRESFLSAFYTPKNRVAWTDDVAWARATRSFGALARAAKASGLKGFFMDLEEYNPPKQFSWAVGDPPFSDCAKLARRRGRELFTALWRNYPEAWVFSCYGLLAADADFDYFGSPDPLDATRQKRDLWPHFFNGMLDAMPPGVRLVDGTEQAYEFEEEREEFAKAALMVKTRALALVVPENQAKYRAAVSASFGIFLDAYVRPNEQDRYWFGALHGSRLGHLDNNLAGAVNWCDDYVWIYAASQKLSAIPWKGIRGGFGNWPTPEKRLPGYSEILLAHRDAQAFFERRCASLAAAGALTNLCSVAITSILKLDAKDPRKAFGVVEFPDAQAGDWYGYAFRAKGEVNATVRWSERGLKRRPKGATIPPMVTPMSAPDAKGWRKAVGVVRIPNDRHRPVLVFKTNTEVLPDSAVADFVLYRLLTHQTIEVNHESE